MRGKITQTKLAEQYKTLIEVRQEIKTGETKTWQMGAAQQVGWQMDGRINSMPDKKERKELTRWRGSQKRESRCPTTPQAKASKCAEGFRFHTYVGCTENTR